MKLTYWLLCSLFCFSIGSCCGTQCNADDLAEARAKLQTIESQRLQQDEIEKAQLKADAAVVEVSDTPIDSTPIAETPAAVPDLISTPPRITLSRTVASAGQRLPRAVLVSGLGCAPCLRMERELTDLIGGPEAPIQLVQNWLANDLEKWGLNPGMQIRGTPYLFVLGADGKIHDLTLNGLGCVLSGFQNRGEVIKYLSLPEHGVNLEPIAATSVIATIVTDEVSPNILAAAMAQHLIECSGQQAKQDLVVGGLFDFTVDVPKLWKDFAGKIATAQKINFEAAGVTLDWSGPARTLTVTKDGVTLNPPVKVSLKKWLINYSCMLDGVSYTPGMDSVTLLLTGAPDLTIHLVTK